MSKMTGSSPASAAASRLTLASMLAVAALGTAGCRKPPVVAESQSPAPTAPPDPSHAGGRSAKSTIDAALLTQTVVVADAFKAAFPNGAKEAAQGGGDALTFTPQRLVSVNPDAGTVALLAKGENPDACHACAGKLRVVYLLAGLANDGSGHPVYFVPLDPPLNQSRWDIDGDGFGQAPQWSFVQDQGVPAIRVTTGYTVQGCTSSAVATYQLKGDGVIEDKGAGRPGKDCG